jgi:superfamily I DNA/RNA helicase
MDKPEIAEVHADDFNKLYPHLSISEDKKANLDEGSVDAQYKTDGDFYLQSYRNCRARMEDPGRLDIRVTEFIKAWESWKTTNGLVDFTDMIDFTIQAGTPPPGDQIVGIYDEVQDFNRLELTLVRKWAEHQEFVILGGDDDQCLYSFTGASPDAFLDPPVPDIQKRVLSQSWRVPRAVQRVASRWIEQVARREPKEYKPRDVEGEVREIHGCTFKRPERVIDDAERYVAAGKSVMFLTTCGYMLNDIKRVLKDRGLPFHNPYRRTRGDWNPLGSGGKNRTTTADRLVAYLRTGQCQVGGQDYWDFETLHKWLPLVGGRKLLQKGAREFVENMVEFQTAYEPAEILEAYYKIFVGESLSHALQRDLAWLQANLLASREASVGYPLKVIEKQGLAALAAKPRIIISTIHGVKGGEADVVYLFPDVSLPGYQGWQKGGEDRDAIVRAFYVGMTRARETLITCQPWSNMHVRL